MAKWCFDESIRLMNEQQENDVAKPTIKSLQNELAALRETSTRNYEVGNKWHLLAQEREKQVATVKEQFADLKKRLHNAETEVARLNGYLARVREDDTVREELVATGDPNGGQRLVPKRKHEFLGSRDDCADGITGRTGMPGYYDLSARNHEKPKHWIEY